MADLDVEKKKNNDWWKWLLGILALIVILWLIFDTGDDDEIEEIDDMETTAYVEPSPEEAKDKKVYIAKF